MYEVKGVERVPSSGRDDSFKPGLKGADSSRAGPVDTPKLDSNPAFRDAGRVLLQIKYVVSKYMDIIRNIHVK